MEAHLMGKQSGRSDRRTTALTQFSLKGMKWGRLAFSHILIAAVMVAGIQVKPAEADELTAWEYDSNTRSLSFLLPDAVMPSVSVVAPNRLLLELPDTQVGDVAGQTVGDGLVESIVLEQATPETVWMVVEFAVGTVLAEAQSVAPTGFTASLDSAQDSGAADLQEWQMQPALVASRRTVAAANSASRDTASEPLGAGTGSADSLRQAPVSLAEVPDFPDLPVLEPSVADEPVSVPPIDSLPDGVGELPVPVVPVPTSESSPEVIAPMAEGAPIEIPVISDSEPVEEEPIAESDFSEEDFSTAATSNSRFEGDDFEEAEAPLPEAPPFIGELGNDAGSAADVPVEPAIALPEESDKIADSSPATSFPPIEADEVIAAPVIELPVQNSAPTEANRWPEPVPFGQPLPQ
ncbi:MAG: hypothetical protein AAF171_26255 [Cyanobacteria bacterium P01_A01_bin.116]